jgi:hypothetical protein
MQSPPASDESDEMSGRCYRGRVEGSRPARAQREQGRLVVARVRHQRPVVRRTGRLDHVAVGHGGALVVHAPRLLDGGN